MKFGVKGRERSFLELGLGELPGADDARELADILNDPDQEENVLRWGALAPRLFGQFEERALQTLCAED